MKGSELGLFDYKPFDYPFVPKEKLIEDYKVHLSLIRLAKVNNISLTYLQKLFTAYGITQEDLRSTWVAGKKVLYINSYNGIKDELGHDPTTTELQQRLPTGRSLYANIARLWGSFDAFREELNIPKPPQGSHSFREDTRKWRETKQKLTLIVRMQHLDRIRECLAQGPMSTKEIAYECGLSLQRTFLLLKLLLATGEVNREGRSASTKYRLARN